MGDKQRRKGRSDATFKFRCRQADLDEFRRRAEEEGFGGNISAWLLWHLRRIAREEREKEK